MTAMTAIKPALTAAVMLVIAAAPSAAQPGPATLDQLCGTLAWPRPIPDVTGQLLSQTIKRGALGCWTNVVAVATDGHDYRIAAVSPGAGTLAGRNEVVTLQLTAADVTAAPAFRPCDWVSADEAGALLGAPVQTRALGDQPGSVDMSCSYASDTSDTGMQSELRLPQSFPVTAAAQFGLATSGTNGTPVDGLGVLAQCVYEATTTPPSTTVVVLLDGNRLYRATSWYGTSCDRLEQFAQTAIGRIGA
jgi:hypothetical protein